jgi:hypothetical protein
MSLLISSRRNCNTSRFMNTTNDMDKFQMFPFSALRSDIKPSSSKPLLPLPMAFKKPSQFVNL